MCIDTFSLHLFMRMQVTTICMRMHARIALVEYACMYLTTVHKARGPDTAEDPEKFQAGK